MSATIIKYLIVILMASLLFACVAEAHPINSRFRPHSNMLPAFKFWQELKLNDGRFSFCPCSCAP